MKKKLLPGEKFGNWTVCKFTKMKKGLGQLYLVRCKCGYETEKAIAVIRNFSVGASCSKCGLAKAKKNMSGWMPRKQGDSNERTEKKS